MATQKPKPKPRWKPKPHLGKAKATRGKTIKWEPRFFQTDRNIIAAKFAPIFDAIFKSPRGSISPRLDTGFSPRKGISINFTVNPGLKTGTAKRYLNALGFDTSFIVSYLGALSGSASTPGAMRKILEEKGYKKDRVDLILRQLASLGTIREDRNRSDADELIKLGTLKKRIPRTQWELWFSILKKLSGEKLMELLTTELKNRDKWGKRLKRANKNWKDVYLTENVIAEITMELFGETDPGKFRTKLIRYRGMKITLGHHALLYSLNNPGETHDEILAILMGQ